MGGLVSLFGTYSNSDEQVNREIFLPQMNEEVIILRLLPPSHDGFTIPQIVTLTDMEP